MDANQDEQIFEGNVFPIFYKKKVLPLDKLKQLESELPDLIAAVAEPIETNMNGFDIILNKHDAFVSRLETYLAKFKKDKAQEIEIVEDMHRWSPRKRGSSASDGDNQANTDAIKRLEEWYNVEETNVKNHREAVNESISSMFTNLDKFTTLGELDPPVSEFDPEPVDSEINDSKNIFWIIVLIVIWLLHVLTFYEHEDVKKCTDEPGKCIIRNIMQFFTFIHDHYLAFHNITLEYPSMAALKLNSSVNVTNEFLES